MWGRAPAPAPRPWLHHDYEKGGRGAWRMGKMSGGWVVMGWETSGVQISFVGSYSAEALCPALGIQR